MNSIHLIRFMNSYCVGTHPTATAGKKPYCLPLWKFSEPFRPKFRSRK